MTNIRYRLGLDIGIASVGWAVLRHDKDGNPDKIINRGVRVFEACEKPKDGKSLAAARREFRGLRRRLRRKKHRLDRIKELICSEFNISLEYLNSLFESNTPRKDVYVIRFEALDKKIEKEEWARLLVHFAQKRGFKSNRKNEKTTDETGKLKAAIKTNEQLMESKGCRTIGELLYKNYKRTKQKEDGSFVYYFETRNKAGKYDLTFSRKQVDDEVEFVFNAQKKLGNKFASDDIKEKYKEILFSQRNFDEGPGQGSRWRGKGNMIEKMVGTCTFEKDEPRAPKNSYTFERFMLIQKVNNLRLLGSPQKELTAQEKTKIINEAYLKSTLTFKQIRKLLDMGDYIESGKPQYVFNASIYSQRVKEKTTDGKTAWNYLTYEKCEESAFIRLKGYHDIKRAVEIDTLTPQDLDDIAYCLTVYKNDERLKEALSQRNFKEELIKEIIDKAPNFDKFGHLSIKAMNKILPHLENGLTYDKACLEAGYDFRNQNKTGERVTKLYFNDIASEIYTPVAKRAVSQTVKVVNAIIREYGPPDCIHIELAREMAKNFEERKKLQEKNQDNQARNERMMSEIREYESAPIKPGGQDLEKYKLWIEQKNYCAYSGERITIQDLFTNAAEIDHIIPYSKSFDNSYNNKVVVKTKYNQEKSNHLPMEYIKTKGDKEVKRFKDWVDDVIKNRTKKNNLLATEIDEQGLTQRNLQDTQYATRTIADFVRNKLQFTENDKFVNKVVCLNGGVTSYIRRRLGLGKDRSTDNHHAEDAIIIASCSQGMQKKISDYEKIRRACNFKDDDVWIDRETGEVIKMAREFPQPWPNFRKEVILWFEENPQSEINLKMRRELLPAYEEDEIIKPLFVSRMSNHKITGAAHGQPIRTEEKESEEHIIKRVPLIELKLIKGKNNEDEIKDYYNKECDKFLYNALLKKLVEFDGDAKEAFKEPFYKPKSNGQNGNIVSYVKIDSGKTSSNINLEKTGAKAANGDMVRIDVFYKLNKKTDKKQFYFVPIYVADFKKKELPNVSTSGYEMKEEKGYKFEFSLYAKDLMRIKKKDKAPEMLYYTNAGIATGSINAIPHNNTQNKIESIGVQKLEIFEKWEIDFLGNYCKAPHLPRNIKTLHGRRKKDYLIK